MKLQGMWSGQSTTSPSVASSGPAPPVPMVALPSSSRILEE
jgi:hypothetical protein